MTKSTRWGPYDEDLHMLVDKDRPADTNRLGFLRYLFETGRLADDTTRRVADDADVLVEAP